MIYNINNHIKNKNLVEIYSKSRDNFEYDDFILGIIIKNLGKYILVKTLDDSALVDSYTLILLNDISKISYNTSYTKVYYEYVRINIHNNIYDPFNLHLQSLLFKDLDLYKIIDYCLKKQKVLSVCTNVDNDLHKGRIITYDKSYIVLNEKKYEHTFGVYDREKNTIINLNNITAIDILSKENNLYENYLNIKH